MACNLALSEEEESGKLELTTPLSNLEPGA